MTRLNHPRPRITNRALESTEPITMMVAASGWGKTWAAAQIVKTWTGESVWITGQEDHADATRFTTDLWQQLAKNKHVPAGTIDPRALERLPDVLEPQRRLLIVVDEAERIHPDPIVALMRAALAHNATFKLIILLRRGRYPKDLYPGIPPSSINLITSDELAFTREEVEALGGPGSPALARYDSHGGWPVAVATLNQQGDNDQGLAGLIHRALDALPQDVRELVTQLATSTVWSDALAERMVGIPPQEWQETVVGSGLPVHRGGLNELRPHNLVRETLVKELREHPGKYRRALLTTADHLELRGDMRQALALLQEAASWHQLARVLCDYVDPLAANQRWQEIVDVTQGLPLAKLPAPKNAYLKHLAGIAHVNVAQDLRALYAAGYASQVGVEPGSRSDPTLLQAKGEALIKAALRLDPNSQLAHVSRVMLAVKRDDLISARDSARQGWGLGEQHPIWHAHLGVLLGMLEVGIDGFQAAASTATHVRQTIRYTPNPNSAIHAVRALEYHFRGLTDPGEIERVRQHLKTTAADPLNDADRLYLAAVSEAMLRQERPNELLDDLEELRSRANRPHPRSLQLIHRYRGIALLMQNRVDEGVASLKRAYQLTQHDPIVRSRTTTSYHLALLRAGNTLEAEELLKEMPTPRAPAERADQGIQRAAQANAQGQHQQALEHLEELRPHLPGFTPFGRTVHATLELTATLAAQQDHTEALNTLDAQLSTPSAAQGFWWLTNRHELQRELESQGKLGGHTIMTLMRANSSSPSPTNVQPTQN